MLKHNLLDHGYLRFVEDWGKGDAMIPEAGIIEAARMSTHKAFQGWEADEKLLAYLYNHKHSTPFEFAGMTLEVHAPIMVFREWQRHRTQGYGEMSARYIPMPDEHYIPDFVNLLQRVDAQTTNKQAQSVRQGDYPQSTYIRWLESLGELYKHSETIYKAGLEIGVPKELARLPVCVARYSRMRATANLRNWLAFLTLRMDPNAQWEIRQYANACGEVIKTRFPRTWNLFALERGYV